MACAARNANALLPWAPTKKVAKRSLAFMAERARVTAVVNDLFPLYLDRPDLLPAEWQADVAAVADRAGLARIVADYVSGMTDRFALQEHARLCG